MKPKLNFSAFMPRLGNKNKSEYNERKRHCGEITGVWVKNWGCSLAMR